ncbi:uncharacterized protein [Antedon mediterranea]|uniref:uncharacterized protein isoform X2 n=1 Tax=Antedon mediterranea TaxID=105859 RepID=UPI003AF476E2
MSSEDNQQVQSNEGETEEPTQEEPAAPNSAQNSPKDKKMEQQFLAEMKRLKTSLERESTKIIKPEFKPYSPFIWSSLEPYYNTYLMQYMADMPPAVRHGYITRKTAIGLVDPEVSHSMDIVVDPVPASVPCPTRPDIKKIVLTRSSDNKEGSTRLPRWPVVSYKRPVPNNTELNWGDVPSLRSELGTKYSSNAHERKQKDYTRTKQDWSRMELFKLKELHEINREHMRMTCNAYLGTSPGSRKAVEELAQVLE